MTHWSLAVPSGGACEQCPYGATVVLFPSNSVPLPMLSQYGKGLMMLHTWWYTAQHFVKAAIFSKPKNF